MPDAKKQPRRVTATHQAMPPNPRNDTPAVAAPGILTHFPPAFTPRAQQCEAIEKIDKEFKAGKRVVLLEMPTGGGKSFLNLCFARQTRAQGKRVHYLTSSKILQDQLESDFVSPELELIKGRNAYPCTHPEAAPTDNCAYAPCTRRGRAILDVCCGDSPETARSVVQLNAAPNMTSCPYWRQLIVASRAPITLYNFSSFLFQQRIGRFGKRDLLILDEVHNCEAQLLGFVELAVSDRQLALVDETIPQGLRSAEAVQRWLQGGLLKKVADAAADENTPILDKEKLERLQAKLEVFLEYIDRTEWIVVTEEAHAKFGRRLLCRPVYANDFADDLLFSKANRILGVSATILDKGIWARNLGLPPAEVGFVQLGSDFPVANRPIKREYLGQMNYKNKAATLPKLVAWIRDTLLPRHKGERGIIHTHSFANAQAIVAGVGSRRLLLHAPGQDKREVLALHAKRADSVIVAPAFHEGVDLKDDLSRFQVIAKAPYPNLNDPVLKRRMVRQEGRDFYLWLTLLKFCQSVGRSVRSNKDHAITYLTDTGFSGLLGRGRRLLPGWIKEALV